MIEVGYYIRNTWFVLETFAKNEIMDVEEAISRLSLEHTKKHIQIR